MKHGLCRFYLLLFVIFFTFGSVLSACTFPTYLTGNWVSSEKGTLNFTGDSLYAYPMDLTTAVQSVDFECMTQNDTLYLLKSKVILPLFGHNFDVYLCLDIHPISRYKYWYQVAQNKEPSTGERFYAGFAGTTVTEDSACNRAAPYEYVTFNTLVKEESISHPLIVTPTLRQHQLLTTRPPNFRRLSTVGAYENGLIEATCPKTLLHTFSNGNLTSSDGVTSCSNVTLDVCTDRTQMRLTYDTSCDASLTIASGGMSECLHYLTNDASGITYLHVWNNDTILATGVGRINCYAFEKNGDTMLGTLYPSACDSAQTTSSVPSPGIIVGHGSVTNTCQDTVEGGSQVLYIVAIVLAGVVFILLIILLIYVIRKTKCRCCVKCCTKCCAKCKTNKNRVGQSDEQLTSSRSTGMTSVEDGMDPYERAITRSDQVAPVKMFIAKKAIKLGPIIEPYLEPPAKVELLYEVEPRPTSSRVMFNRSMFFSQVSLRFKD